ncbi:MAG: hypothetical protein EOO07_32980 [Chitinophagaceae bacterium]|nr:MAG: hypothetical protein EOO07_32980 [Chitinophagaceae bacterium]
MYVIVTKVDSTFGGYMKCAFLQFFSPLFSISVSILFSVTVAADETRSASIDIPAEYVNSCKGLSEKDSCQVHGKTNNLLTGICTTKAVTNDDVELVCRPEQLNNTAPADSEKKSDQETHHRNAKHH